MFSFKRKALVVATASLAVVVAGLVLGLLAGPGADTPMVFGQMTACQNTNTLPACGITDTTRTSSLTVYHATNDTPADPVEPDDGETWNITAYWNTAPSPPCWEISETASVEVSWNGTAWVLSNKSTTTHITGIDVCDPDDVCSRGGTGHDYEYELIVDVDDPVVVGPYAYNLRQVVYTTTSMDDGYVIDTASCTLGSGVTPTADSFTQTDSGQFDCAFDCTASGLSVTIQYN